MKFLLGIKQNMSEYFSEDGRVFPVTIIEAGPATVTKVLSKEKDGYAAVQIGVGLKKKISKPLAGQLKGLANFRYIREFRLDVDTEYKVGDVLNVADLFKSGDKVWISGNSKGKGFQGVVKRHGFGGGPRSHGQKHSEREPGSIGGGLRTRVPTGMRMAGRMGGNRVTEKNHEVIHLNGDKNIVLVTGAVPGRRGSLVEIRMD